MSVTFSNNQVQAGHGDISTRNLDSQQIFVDLSYKCKKRTNRPERESACSELRIGSEADCDYNRAGAMVHSTIPPFWSQSFCVERHSGEVEEELQRSFGEP